MESEEVSNTVIIVACIAAMLILVALVSAFVLCINAKKQWAIHVGGLTADGKKKKKSKRKAGKRKRAKKEPSTRLEMISGSLQDSQEPSSAQSDLQSISASEMEFDKRDYRARVVHDNE